MALPDDKQQRKERPVARGVLDYFPDAVAEVANLSYIGNQQHNPGEEMHWARGKSSDHADCVARHLMERGRFDADGTRHSTKAAWRALALLQLELEQAQSGGIEGSIQVDSNHGEDHAGAVCPDDACPHKQYAATYDYALENVPTEVLTHPECQLTFNGVPVDFVPSLALDPMTGTGGEAHTATELRMRAPSFHDCLKKLLQPDLSESQVEIVPGLVVSGKGPYSDMVRGIEHQQAEHRIALMRKFLADQLLDTEPKMFYTNPAGETGPNLEDVEPAPVNRPLFPHERHRIQQNLIKEGCDREVAAAILDGVTVPNKGGLGPNTNVVYVAGPMRHHEDFNFPAFDEARDRFVEAGWAVISPADIDRSAGGPDEDDYSVAMGRKLAYRDFQALHSLTGENGDAIAMLPGWESSSGACAEFFLARWLRLRILDASTGQPLNTFDIGALATKVTTLLQEQLNS